MRLEQFEDEQDAERKAAEKQAEREEGTESLTNQEQERQTFIIGRWTQCILHINAIPLSANQLFITALRKLEADTALANAQQENATRIQVDVHKKNQSLADREYDAAVAAEEEADKAVRESKVSIMQPVGKHNK